jgi:hypothetical protein
MDQPLGITQKRQGETPYPGCQLTPDQGLQGIQKMRAMGHTNNSTMMHGAMVHAISMTSEL